MRLKGLLSTLALLVFAGVMVASGTGAFFTDSETPTGNRFTAGALDLLVDSESHYNGMVCENTGTEEVPVYTWQPEDGFDPEEDHYPAEDSSCDGTWTLTDLGPSMRFFNLSDLKPGDSGENTISLHVEDNPAYVCAVVDNMEDNDLGLTEPESILDATDGPGQGELSNEIRFFAWSELDGDNVWEPADDEPKLFSNDEGPASDVIDGVSYPLFTPVSDEGVGPTDPSSTNYDGHYWCYGDITINPGASSFEDRLSCDGSGVTNSTQSDQLLADITFYAEQARHNDAFECPDVEPSVPSPFILAEIVSKEVEGSGDEDIEEGTFTVKFDVTALDNDYYLASTTDASLTYHMERNGVVIATSTLAMLTATANTEANGNFKVSEGDTETFTLTVVLNPDVAGLYTLQLDTLNFSLTNTGLVDSQSIILEPSADFETDAFALSA